jgi:hypothetical protein
VAGVAVAIGLAIWTKVAGLNPRSWEAVAVTAGIFLAGAAGVLAIVFLYRIRIDERGVWRRRLVRWDLWPWEAFEGGHIRHGRLGDQLTYPTKGWYWRTISTSVLRKPDRAAFERAVARFRIPPPPPHLPDVLSVKYGLRARFELSADGVRLIAHRHDAGELFPWPQVVKVELVRSTHDRPDFVALFLHLPGLADPVRLARPQGHPTWSGADAEVIALYLERHLDNGRFVVTALSGPPIDVQEADRRLAQLDKSEHELQRANRVLWYLYLGAILVMTVVLADVWNRPNPMNWRLQDWIAVSIALGGATVSTGLLAVTQLGVVYFRLRDMRRERGELIRWKACFAGAVSVEDTTAFDPEILPLRPC